MLVDLSVVGTAGLLLGLWFRVPALLASSGANAAVYLSVAPIMDMPLMTVVVVSYLLLSVLQISYLLCLMLSHVWSRAKL